MNVPNCCVPDCTRKAQHVNRRVDGSIIYRKSSYYDGGYICTLHHQRNPNNDMKVSELWFMSDDSSNRIWIT